MAEQADRRLVLVRHAKSSWPGVADHDRPLAPRGRRDAPAMGRWLRGAGYVPDRVICSTALRARQTWQGVAAALGATPPARFEPAVYGAPAAGLLGLTQRAPAAVRTLLLVGHNPAVAELALMLTGEDAGDAAGDLVRMRVKFPTAAIAVLEFAGGWPQLGPGRARLARFVTPRDVGQPAA